MANPTIAPAVWANGSFTVTGSTWVAFDIALIDPTSEEQMTITAPAGAVIVAIRSPAGWTTPGTPLLSAGAWSALPLDLGNWHVTITPGATATDPATVKVDSQASNAGGRLRLVCSGLTGALTVEPSIGDLVIDRVLATPNVTSQVLSTPPVRELDTVDLSASVNHSKVEKSPPQLPLMALPPMLAQWAADPANPVALPSFHPPVGVSASFKAPAIYAQTVLNFNLTAVLDLAGNGIDAVDPVTTGVLPVTIVQVRYGMVLVLDRSGSMGATLGGGMSKWDAAVRAAHAWADLFRAFRPTSDPLLPHLAGVVTFQSDSGGTAVTPEAQAGFKDPSPGSNPNIAVPPPQLKDLVNFGNFPKWNLGSQATSTPIGDGLVAAWQAIGQQLSPGDKASVVLMTDGYENAGAVTIAAVPPAGTTTFASLRTGSLLAGNKYIGDRLYTLALGSQVDDQRLHVLSGGGYYQQITQSTNEIGPAFAAMLGDVLNSNPAKPGPPLTSDPDAHAEAVYYQVSTGERILAFLVQWADNTHALRVGYRLQSVPPNPNTPFTIVGDTGDAKVKVTLRETHGLMRIDLPALLADLSSPGTEWRLQDVVGNAPQPDLVDRAFVMVDLVTKVDVGFSKTQYFVGEPIGLETRIATGGVPVTGAKVLIDSARPGESLGSYLTVNARKYKDLHGDIPRAKTDPAIGKGLMVQTLLHMDGLSDLPIVRDSGLVLKDDGLHADGLAGDGFYANTFADTGTEGTYTFRFRVDGNLADGSKFSRVFDRSVWVGLRPDPAQLGPIWVLLTDPDIFPVRSSFSFKPMFGKQYLGPFRGDAIELTIFGGKFDGDLIDNIDGSYTITVIHDPGATPTVSVSIWGQPMVPSSPPTAGIGPFGTNCWQLWLAAIRCTLAGIWKLLTGK